MPQASQSRLMGPQGQSEKSGALDELVGVDASTPVEARLQSALSGVYRVEREIAGGGSSRVFAAVECALDRRVVVKVLPPDLAAAVSVERFNREIHFVAKLQHPAHRPTFGGW